MNSLPIELWIYIAAFLPIVSLANFSMTCRSGYKAARGCLYWWLEKSGVADVVKIERMHNYGDMEPLIRIAQNKHAIRDGYWLSQVPFTTDDEFERFISVVLYTDRVSAKCTKEKLADTFYWIETAMIHLNVVRMSLRDLGVVVSARNTNLCKRGMDAVRACHAFNVTFIEPKSFLMESVRAWINREIFRTCVDLFLEGIELPLAMAPVANRILQEAEDLLANWPSQFCHRLLHCGLHWMVLQMFAPLPGGSALLQEVVTGQVMAHDMYEGERPTWISDAAWDRLAAFHR